MMRPVVQGVGATVKVVWVNDLYRIHAQAFRADESVVPHFRHGVPFRPERHAISSSGGQREELTAIAHSLALAVSIKREHVP